ncbi:MAG: poly(A) polymerase [Bdellovibrio sp. CG10_big_fil_rev_8_21_14_0_10_47_8]|nr:MAG: poly(A) polymerase [Bdellovibrio sp. CG10_big_fil_rev_8_21_14_0_10_47_8]
MLEIKQKPRLHASWIDPNAKEIVQALQRSGFTTYLVGGCVRDLLAGIHPKDFDIATNAEPNQVKRKVWGSYVIGRRFRLVLVKRGDQQYEVATFRREGTQEDLDTLQQNAEAEENDAPASADNFFGTPEQDAIRRDFTINALFYDPIKDELIDYCHGMKDIESRTLRMIGDPAERIKEDPIRSLRAIRLTHKLGFQIEPTLRQAIHDNAAEVARSVLPRRREEYLKFLRLKDPVPAWMEMYDLGLIEHCLPSLVPVFSDPERRDVFLSYIQRLNEICVDTGQPTQLLAPFVLGYIRAMDGHPQFKTLLESLLKDELMMFKAEQAVVMGAIDLMSQLPDTESFLRRGHRRQVAFLRNEMLPMTLRMAKVDCLISGAQYSFWVSQLNRLFDPQA